MILLTKVVAKSGIYCADTVTFAQWACAKQKVPVCVLGMLGKNVVLLY